MLYVLVVCEPGKKAPVCTFRGVIAQDECPQVGEERVFHLTIQTKAGYETSCDVTVRIVRKQKGIMFSAPPSPGGRDRLHETLWSKVYAEPTAKNYSAGLRRLIHFAETLENRH